MFDVQRLSTCIPSGKKKGRMIETNVKAFECNFHLFPFDSKYGCPVYLIISPTSPLFSSGYDESALASVRCKVKVEVCIVPVLSHNRWGGNEYTDIVEEGSPVIKQREQSTHIQCNDQYYVLWVYVTQAHKGSFITQLSYATLHFFSSRLWESCSGVSFMN